MTTIDRLERDLLYNSNDPVYVGGAPIYPVTIRDIRRMGYAHYKTLLGIICLTSNDIKAILKESSEDAGVPLYFLISILEYNENQRADILEAFRMVCHEDPSWNFDTMEIYAGGGVLTSENFTEFQTVVKERNKVPGDASDDENPADEYTRRLLAKSRAIEEKKAKQRGDDEGVTLADLISICAAKLQVHPDCIGDYDMYQLNDVLGRFKIFDDYETNINALLHGAKKEDIDLQHWISGNQSLFK